MHKINWVVMVLPLLVCVGRAFGLTQCAVVGRTKAALVGVRKQLLVGR